MTAPRVAPHPQLTVVRHDRDVLGLRYVYPVLSRRSGGVSVGINLNPNNACNWQCIYCQVENLTRGQAPRIDLGQLEQELTLVLDGILNRGWLEQWFGAPTPELRDLALSGNGEPTSSPDLRAVLEVIGRARHRFALPPSVSTVLITNGSLLDRREVRESTARLAGLAGVVWFKLDAGSDEELSEINGTRTELKRHLQRLVVCSELCSTFVQTCVFRTRDEDPSPARVAAYLDALKWALEHGARPHGVLLYTIARPCLQPTGTDLTPTSREFLDELAARVHELGLVARVAV